MNTKNFKVAQQLVRVAKQLIQAEQGRLEVLEEADAESLSPEARENWHGYYYSINYETWTDEDKEHGETDKRGWYVESSDTEASLEELLRYLDYERPHWIGWINAATPWIESQADEDYSTNEDTYHHAFIHRMDKKPLSKREMAYISKELNLKGF